MLARTVRKASRPLALSLVLVLVAVLTSRCAPHKADLTFMCSTTTSICEAWERGLERDLGISVTYVSSPTQEALRRLSGAGGALDFDLWVGGPSENYRTAALEGLLEPSHPANASSMAPPFRDEADHWFGVYSSVLALCSNPSVLATLGRQAPTSWAELTDPSWRGLVSASSPLSSGTAYTTVLTLDTVFGTSRELTAVLSNVGRFTRSGTAPASVVAQGEAAVAISFQPYCAAARGTDGQPLLITYPREGTSFEIAAAAVLRGARHEATAHRALDWLLSPAGQSAPAEVGLPLKPVNPQVAGNMEELLATTELPLIHLDPQEAVEQRGAWMRWFTAWSAGSRE